MKNIKEIVGNIYSPEISYLELERYKNGFEDNFEHFTTKIFTNSFL
jgi:hypothetical protein